MGYYLENYDLFGGKLEFFLSKKYYSLPGSQSGRVLSAGTRTPQLQHRCSISDEKPADCGGVVGPVYFS